MINPQVEDLSRLIMIIAREKADHAMARGKEPTCLFLGMEPYARLVHACTIDNATPVPLPKLTQFMGMAVYQVDGLDLLKVA